MRLCVIVRKSHFESAATVCYSRSRYDRGMKRRAFFRRVLGSLGATLTGSNVGARARDVLVSKCPVAGFRFHDGEQAWQSLVVGAALRLVRERTNVHDASAVAVYFGALKLGYVPRGDNSSIADLLDRGETLQAHVLELTQSDDPWERVQIGITLVC